MTYSLKNNEQGFTIVEMMVGIALGLILLGVAVKIFLVQQKAFREQLQVSEMQQNLRVAMEMMSREIRMAGYMVDKNTFNNPITNPGTDTITFLSDIDSDIATITTTIANVGTTTIYVDLSDANDTVETTDYIYISDGINIDFILPDNPPFNTTGEPDTILLSTPLSNSYDAGSSMVRTVEQISYSINNTDPAHPYLQRNDQVLADNIEALNFTYGTNTVNINLTARTNKKDYNYKGDGYRRWTLTSTIKLRNRYTP